MWQAMVNDQTRMTSMFKAAMHKLELLGQPDTLVDCSDVVPVPPALNQQSAAIPAGFTEADIEGAVGVHRNLLFSHDYLKCCSAVRHHSVPDAPHHPWPGDLRPTCVRP